MNFKEWLKSTEFGIKRRYKIKDFAIQENGYMQIVFTNNFHYVISENKLKMLWKNNDFGKLCEDIEGLFLKEILNI